MRFDKLWHLPLTVCFVLLSAQPANAATDEVPLDRVWEDLVQTLSTPAMICEAVYGHLAAQPTLAGLAGKKDAKTNDYAARRDALSKRMRTDVAKVMGKENLEEDITLSRQSILAQVAPEAIFIGDYSGRLYAVAAACDRHFNQSPKTPEGSLKGPLQTVVHSDCAKRYFTLALGLRQNNPQFSQTMHKRALLSATRHDAYLARNGGAMDEAEKKRFNARVEQASAARLKAMQGNQEAVRRAFIDARACDSQYRLQATPVPGEGKR